MSDLLTLMPQKKGVCAFTMIWVFKSILCCQVITFKWSFVLDFETHFASIFSKHQNLAFPYILESLVPIHHINYHRLLIFIFYLDQSALMLEVPARAFYISITMFYR